LERRRIAREEVWGRGLGVRGSNHALNLRKCDRINDFTSLKNVVYLFCDDILNYDEYHERVSI